MLSEKRMQLFLLYLDLSNFQIRKQSNFITCRDMFGFYRQALLRCFGCFRIKSLLLKKKNYNSLPKSSPYLQSSHAKKFSYLNNLNLVYRKKA